MKQRRLCIDLYLIIILYLGIKKEHQLSLVDAPFINLSIFRSSLMYTETYRLNGYVNIITPIFLRVFQHIS